MAKIKLVKILNTKFSPQHKNFLIYGSPGIIHRLRWILRVLYKVPEKARWTDKCVIMCTVYNCRGGGWSSYGPLHFTWGRIAAESKGMLYCLQILLSLYCFFSSLLSPHRPLGKERQTRKFKGTQSRERWRVFSNNRNTAWKREETSTLFLCAWPGRLTQNVIFPSSPFLLSFSLSPAKAAWSATARRGTVHVWAHIATGDSIRETSKNEREGKDVERSKRTRETGISGG